MPIFLAAYMDRKAHPPWLRMAALVAVVYSVVGLAFAVLANPSLSHEMRLTWRLAAWLVSAAAFGAHLAYEHFRRHNPPSRAAWHVAVAVALGAFALAVGVNVHAHRGASGDPNPLAPLALVTFPVVTGGPAFAVALVAVTLLARTRRQRP